LKAFRSRFVTPSVNIDRRGAEILKDLSYFGPTEGCQAVWEACSREPAAAQYRLAGLESFFFRSDAGILIPSAIEVNDEELSVVLIKAAGSMRHSFSYEIRNQPTALQGLKQELDSTLSTKLKGFDARATVLLVIDELVSNLLKYGFDGEPDQRSYLKIEFDDEWLEIEIKDNGHRFNPLVHPEPVSLAQELPDRAVGGLGLYLVLKMMDETHYDWIQPWNCLRLRKKMKNTFNEFEN
jgi:serine/threonine-protein kinase RsbW